MDWTGSLTPPAGCRQRVLPAIRRRAPAETITVFGFAVLAIAFAITEQLWPAHVANLGARGAIEATVAICAFVGAALLGERSRRTRRWRDVLLLAALVTVAATDFTYLAVPALTGSARVGLTYDVRVITQVIVAAAFVAAAFAPSDRTVRRQWPVVLVGVIGVGALMLAEVLDAVTPHGGPNATAAASVAAPYDSVLLWVTIGAATAQFVAGAAFAWRPRPRSQRASLIAGASFLLGAVRLQYLALPVVADDWVTPADAFRLIIYGLLLTVAVQGQLRARRMRSQGMLDAERVRIARDIHDGIAQDLAVIVTQGQRLALQLGDEHPVMVAARRALAVSRGAIADLSASQAPSVDAALREVAEELESLHNVDVVVHTELGDDGEIERLGADDREHVVRIAREAIVNAVKHGHATRVDVVLDGRGSRMMLRISDDGDGIAEPRLAAHRLTAQGGCGLPAMRDRAAALGGQLTARRPRAGGTVIELTVLARQAQ